MGMRLRQSRSRAIRRCGLSLSSTSAAASPPDDTCCCGDKGRRPEQVTVRLEGIHHVTAITGDAQPNVDFYAGVLGLRMVKKTVNQDDPTVYHLFYADEKGSAGADLTFFEYPGATPGTPGAGMVHRIAWRGASPAAIDFWEQRLRFADPEGLDHELVVSTVADAPLIADAPDVPAEHALQGFDGVRAYAHDPARSEPLLRGTLGFTGGEDGRWEVRGEERGGIYAYDA